MSTVIKNALSGLNGALDRLEQAVVLSAERSQERQRDLFAAQSALNDNSGRDRKIPGITRENAEVFARSLDKAIGQVERMMQEGRNG